MFTNQKYSTISQPLFGGGRLTNDSGAESDCDTLLISFIDCDVKITEIFTSLTRLVIIQLKISRELEVSLSQMGVARHSLPSVSALGWWINTLYRTP